MPYDCGLCATDKSMRGILCAALVLALPTVIFGAEPKSEIRGFAYAQLTFEPVSSAERSGLGFDADRVRIGAQYHQGSWFGRGQLDLNSTDNSERAVGSLPNLIQELYAGYFVDNGLVFRVGQMRVPVGMEFHVAGNELDLVKRGMDSGLVMDRSLGFMVSGRQIAGLIGYDFGVFNVAGRSAATAHDPIQQGDLNAFAARISVTADPYVHVEASAGFSPEAGGNVDSDAYLVLDAGLRASWGRFVGKAEIIFGDGLRGNRDHAQTVLLLHAGYRWTNRIEWVARVYAGSSTLDDEQTVLQNTYLGATFHFADGRDTHHRLQVNYILATGEPEFWSGIGGFISDSLFMQYQMDFDFQ